VGNLLSGADAIVFRRREAMAVLCSESAPMESKHRCRGFVSAQSEMKSNSMKGRTMNNKSKKQIVVGGVEFTPLFENLVPKITDEEYQRLKEDIESNGVLVPIALDESSGVIDGLNRLRAVSELEHKSVPFHIHANLGKKEKRELAIKLNSLRRNWSKEERLDLAVALRKDKYSFRRIGDILNLSHETVRRHLSELGDTEDFPDTIIGKDGKKRAAQGRRKPCVVLKNTKEAKDAYRNFEGAKGIQLPDSIIDVKRLGRLVRDHKIKNHNTDGLGDITVGQTKLLLGDFMEKGKEIAPDSVDMIFTDPPYGKDDLRLWEDLGPFAKRVLKPGGLLLSYTGSLYLPRIFDLLGKHLEYFWTFAVRHTGGRKTVYPVNVHQAWKPVLGYCKPPFKKYWHTFPDMVSGGQSKDFHEWEQPIEEAHHFIKNLCPKNGVLVDPMAGSGSSILAGMALGMDCTGIEIDTTAFATAKQRIEHVQNKLSKKAEHINKELTEKVEHADTKLTKKAA